LAAHAKLRQVDAGLDGEAGVRQDATLIVDLEIIHVSSVSVDFRANGMAGTVNEVVAESGVLDVSADSAINFPPCNGATLRDGVLNRFHTEISRLANG